MLSGLFHRMLVRRELDAWLTDSCLRAAEALSELALELEARATRDIEAIGIFSSKNDFIALKLAPAVRQSAERVAHELVDQARSSLAVIAPVELFRLRALNYVEPPVGRFDKTLRRISDRLPIGKTQDMRERARRFIIHALLSGSKDAPSLLEQLERDYRDAAERALKLP